MVFILRSTLFFQSRPLTKCDILILLPLLLRTSIGLVHTKAILLSLLHVGQTRQVDSLKTIILTKMSKRSHWVSVLNGPCLGQSFKVKVLLTGHSGLVKCLKTFKPAEMSTPNCFFLNYLDIWPLVFAVSAIHCLLLIIVQSSN